MEHIPHPATARTHGKDGQPLRWTAQREGLLAILTSIKRPVSAYEMIDLYEKAYGRKLQPMLIYRGLDFLIEHGFVAKLASRNSYVPCQHPHAGGEHNCLFFICDECGSAQEMEQEPVDLALKHAAQKAGYRIRRPVVEIEGVCRDCQKKEKAA